MKKYGHITLGILIGFALSFAVGAHAEVVKMIDKVVEGTFPVSIQGKKLDVDAVVIEGSTYLPVRVLGEATGYDVKFDPNQGVSLEKKGTTTTLPEKKKTIEDINYELDNLRSDVQGYEGFIPMMERRLKENPTVLGGVKQLEDLKKQIAEKQTKIAELEKQKAELSQ